MEKREIKTQAGSLELNPATPEELKELAAHWPMGVVFSQRDSEPNGLIFQVGDEEAYCVKLQPPDTDEQSARKLYFRNLVLIAAALPFYLGNQHLGIFLPCAYIKEKAEERFESGLAFFVYPHPVSMPMPGSSRDSPFDDRLGAGSSTMISDMLHAITRAGKEAGLPVNTVISVEVQPRLGLGKLGMPLVVHGRNVFVLEHPIHEEHPMWLFLVRGGFSKLPYAPMIPGAVPGPENAPRSWLERVQILQHSQQIQKPQRTKSNGLKAAFRWLWGA